MAETPNDSSTNGEEQFNTEERKNRLFSAFEVEPDHWKKVGFWCAFDRINPLTAFNNVLNEYKGVFDDLKTTLGFNHKVELGRFYKKIARARGKVRKINEDLQYHRNISDLKTELKTLRDDIKKLEGELVDSYKKLGEAKKNLIQNQIDEVFADLDKITGRYNAVSEQHNEISERAKQRNVKSLGIKPTFLEELRDSYKKIHDDLHNRLTALSKSGISFISRTRLIGYGATLAAGWFFSVFALENKISSNDVPFFLLKGLFGFGGKLNVEGSFALSLLNHVVFVAAALLSVFLVSLLCYRLMDKTEKRQVFSKYFYDTILGDNNNNKNTEDYSQNGDVKQLETELSSANPHVSSKAFFTFWLESLPFLVIFGITFIVISLSNITVVDPSVLAAVPTTPDPLTLLNISLSAQAIGTSLAIGCGGLAYLYIVNIIEPRLERKRKNNPDNSGWFWLNFELVAIITIITVVFSAVLFGVQNLYYGSNKSLFSFSMFIVCILISSMVLGYGSYYLGLIETVSYIEEKMQNLSILTAYNSFPNIRLVMRADRVFRKAYIDLVEKLFKLELNKTIIAEKYFSSDDQSVVRKQRNNEHKNDNRFSYGILNAIRRFFSNSSNPDFRQALSEQERIDEEFRQTEERFETQPQDKEYFPQIACEIENLKGRRNSEMKRLIQIETEVQNRSEDKTPYAKTLLDEIVELEKKIDNWFKHTSALLDIQLKEKSLLFEKQTQAMVQIHDGFDLGTWITGSGIGPIPPDKPMEDKDDFLDQ